MVRFHLRRFEAWAISFTPHCPCLSEETLKAVGPNSCISSRLGCLEYNYLRLENDRDGGVETGGGYSSEMGAVTEEGKQNQQSVLIP